MVYLLDANVLITADHQYYPLDRVPEFWDWLRHQGEQGHVKMPQEMLEEVRRGGDDLADWARDGGSTDALLFRDDVDQRVITRVVYDGYAPDLTAEELEVVGNDPFLIAAAICGTGPHTVVTTEVSKPRRIRQNRHIPNVCDDFGVRWIDTFALVRERDFRTNWRP